MPRVTEVWATGVSLPGVAVRMAQRAEADGFDGWFVVDSQNLAGDCYVALGAGGRGHRAHPARHRRHQPVHPPSGGHRVGDRQRARRRRAAGPCSASAAATPRSPTSGWPPPRCRVFERYLAQLQTYLRGEAVAFAELESATVEEVATLGLAGGPDSSRLHWLPADLPKVPVTVAATGPKVIDVAARVRRPGHVRARRRPRAGGVGHRASPRRAARRAAGSVRQRGVPRRRRCRPGAGERRDVDVRAVQRDARHHPRPDGRRQPIAAAGRARRLRHGVAHPSRSPQAERLTADFAEGFAVLGPAERCIERLQQLDRTRSRPPRDRRALPRVRSHGGASRTARGSSARSSPPLH